MAEKIQCHRCDNEAELTDGQLPEGWRQDALGHVKCPEFYAGLERGDIRRSRTPVAPIEESPQTP